MEVKDERGTLLTVRDCEDLASERATGPAHQPYTRWPRRQRPPRSLDYETPWRFAQATPGHRCRDLSNHPKPYCDAALL